VGEDLASLFEGEQGEAFFGKQIPMMRDGLFYELGVKFPNVTVQVKENLPRSSAQGLLNDVPESRVEIHREAVMVNESAEWMVKQGFTAQLAVNPATGASCAWIPGNQAQAAAESGLVIWDCYEFLILWLSAILRRKAADFIGVGEVQRMLKQIEPVFPLLVAETVPKTVSLFLLTDVLRRLLVEGVSVRNLPKILMCLANWGRVEKDPLFLTEYVRAALNHLITHVLTRGTKQFIVFLLDPDDIEIVVRQSLRSTATGSYMELEPDQLRLILEAIQSAISAIPDDAQVPQILTTMEIRAAIRRLVAFSMPELHVISYQELIPDCNVQPIGRISLNKGINWRSRVSIAGVSVDK
jgi:type III secretion protein V